MANKPPEIFNQETKDKIIAMYKAGIGVSTIAVRLRVGSSAAGKLIADLGLIRDRVKSMKISAAVRAKEKRIT